MLVYGVRSFGSHKHQCPDCGTVWEHSDFCAGSDEAHSCPKDGCGGVSWRKYDGPLPVTPLSGLRKDPYLFYTY